MPTLLNLTACERAAQHRTALLLARCRGGCAALSGAAAPALDLMLSAMQTDLPAHQPTQGQAEQRAEQGIEQRTEQRTEQQAEQRAEQQAAAGARARDAWHARRQAHFLAWLEAGGFAQATIENSGLAPLSSAPSRGSDEECKFSLVRINDAV